MRIGIDISQMVHEHTGVARYVRDMVSSLVKKDTKNTYVLFGASLRKQNIFTAFYRSLGDTSRVRLVVVPIPPTVLDMLWNRMHIVPIEWLIGAVDVFWSSDWTQPPLLHARGVTTIHDVSFLHFPESFDKKIIAVQKRRLSWVLHDAITVLADSKATRDDVVEELKLPAKRCLVCYPGVSL